MPVWNPWRGCLKFSEGCKYCYIHKGDFKRGVNTSDIVRTKDFYKPIERFKNGKYKIKSGPVYLAFSTDFFIPEADKWRDECWKMIKERSNLHFLFLTKRIERFNECIPPDWENGYDNVTVCCTVENQKAASRRLAIFKDLPIKHKCITAQPLLESIKIEKYLGGIDLVVVGGESDYNARVLNFDWVMDIKRQCANKNVAFEFRQCGTNFIKDNTQYYIPTKDLMKQAKKAGINHTYDGGK